MSDFIEVPASKKSISKRGFVYGVGVNDANYIVSKIIDKKSVLCPYYRRWSNMLKRCYKRIDNYCYKGCTVCDEWLVFSNFKKWMKKQDWKGKELDKDILIQGNKIYYPDGCLFVDKAINLLLVDHKKRKGKYPKGVYFKKSALKFVAQCAVNGKEKHIGYYDTIEEARSAYRQFKKELINDIARSQKEPLRTALFNYKV